MTKLTGGLLAIGCLLACSSNANAQETADTVRRGLAMAGSESADGFFDWIHRLSGPVIGPRLGIALSGGFTHPLPLRVNAAAQVRARAAKFDSLARTDSARIESLGRWADLRGIGGRLQPCLQEILVAAALIDESARFQAVTIDRIHAELERTSRELTEAIRSVQLDRRPLRVRGSPAEIVARVCHVAEMVRGLRDDSSFSRIPAIPLRWHVRFAIGGGKDGINMTSVHPSLELILTTIPVLSHFGFEAGVAVNAFHGEDVDTFLSPSFSTLLNFYPAPRSRNTWLRSLRIAAGYHFFPLGFDADAFEPAFTMDEDIGFDAVKTFAIRYDWVRF